MMLKYKMIRSLPENCEESKCTGEIVNTTEVHQHNGGERNVGSNEETKESRNDGKTGDILQEWHDEETDGGEEERDVDNTDGVNTGEVRDEAGDDSANGVADTNDGEQESCFLTTDILSTLRHAWKIHEGNVESKEAKKVADSNQGKLFISQNLDIQH